MISLQDGEQAQAKPAPEKPKPPSSDCQAYDRLAEEVLQLQTLTNCKGWGRFFGGLLREAEEARTQLEFAEKPRDVVRLQATIALVKSQLKKLHQPVEELNGLRSRLPLFKDEFPWRGDFDDVTGRVTLVWTGVTLVWTGTGPAPEIVSPTAGQTADEGEDESADEGQPSGANPDDNKPSSDDDPGDDTDEDEDDNTDEDTPPEPDDPFGEEGE